MYGAAKALIRKEFRAGINEIEKNKIVEEIKGFKKWVLRRKSTKLMSVRLTKKQREGVGEEKTNC